MKRETKKNHKVTHRLIYGYKSLVGATMKLTLIRLKQLALTLGLFSLWIPTEAQTSKPAEAPMRWGIPSCGARISINLTNSILRRGPEIKAAIHITNEWTNFFDVVISNDKTDVAVFLYPKSGKPIRLTRDASHDPHWLRFAETLEPGKVYSSSFLFNIEEAVSPGIYRLNARRNILIPNLTDEEKNRNCEVESNTIEVQVQ